MFQDTVVRAGDLIAGVLDTLDPDAVSGSGARELWSAFDRAERLSAAGKTLLARRIADAHQPGKAGSKTAAEDLARKAGTSNGAAKDAMDTSERLPGQPELDKAIRRGELSAAQAGLVSAAAGANPAEERRLTELAGRVSLGELREECARVRAAADPDPEATNRRLHAGRRLRRYLDSEGFWNLHAKGTPQAGAAFNAVLDPIIDRIFNTAQAHGQREHPDAYAFDALTHLAAHAAGHCDCNQPARGAGNDTADATAGHGGHAEAAGAAAAGAAAAGAAAAGAAAAGAAAAGAEVEADTAGRNAATQADSDGAGADGVDAGEANAAQANAAGANAAGAGAAGAGADAGLNGTASRRAEQATAASEQQAADPVARTESGIARTNRSTDPAGAPSGGVAPAGAVGVRADSDDRPSTRPAAGDPGIFAANASPTGSVGSVGQSGSGSGCAARQSTNPRYLALLRVDAQALRRGHVQGEELCEIAGVGPVPVSVARDLLGDAIMKLVITNGVDVLNVTHLGRGPTTAQKIALLWTNPTCSVRSCDRRRIEWDHQKPWAQTRHSRLDELDPLCGFHHDLKTRLHWALVPGKGKRAFVAPDDPRHPSQQPARAGPAAANTRPPTASARSTRPTATAEDARPPTVPGPAAPPGKASPPRTARQAAAAQMSLPEPPAEQAPQPP